VSLPDDPELRVLTCWDDTTTVEDLVSMLADDREWRHGGAVKFDGDSEVTLSRVSESAVYALAKRAPDTAPPAAVARAVAAAHGRICAIQSYTWAADYDQLFYWKRADLAPFGPALVAALVDLLGGDDETLRRGAEQVLLALGVH
jgi:hypothetical protein